MRNIIIFILSLMFHTQLFAWSELPVAVTNNAVTKLNKDGAEWVCSFMGLNDGKSFANISKRAWCLSLTSKEAHWQEMKPVPVDQGRLASLAVSVHGQIYLFGGYTVAKDGSEVSTPEVFRFSPSKNQYERRADMLLPVDDSVALVWHDRYVVFVSGWHDKDNVSTVQVYDVLENRWKKINDFPGTPVFGHFATSNGSKILLCDGVKVVKQADGKKQFLPSKECWTGRIQDAGVEHIKWSKITHHGRKPRYRAFAKTQTNNALIIGGSENPYNYDGMGYDGKPSEPASEILVYDFTQNIWSSFDPGSQAGMDYRGGFSWNHTICTVGGFVEKQQLSKRVNCRSMLAPAVLKQRISN